MWFLKSARDVLGELTVNSSNGLSSEEAKIRLEKHVRYAEGKSKIKVSLPYLYPN